MCAPCIDWLAPPTSMPDREGTLIVRLVPQETKQIEWSQLRKMNIIT